MTGLYQFGGTKKIGLTTCVPIEKKVKGKKEFGGALCADVAIMGNLGD